MGRSIVLFTLMITTVASASAQHLEFIDFKVSGDQNVWTYSVICPNGSADSLVVHLKIPRSAYVKQVPRTTEYSLEKRIVTPKKKNSLEEKKRVTLKMEYSLQQERLDDGKLRIKFDPLDGSNRTFTFEVIAPKNVTKNGEINWTIPPDSSNTGTIPGPVASKDPIIRPVLGVGGSWRFWEKDFKVENDAVSIKYEGYFQPSLNTGLLLNFNWKNKRFQYLGLLLSLEFGIDDSKIIDGVVCGLTFCVPRFSEIFFGVSMRTEQKLRSEFEDIAKELANDINAMTIEELKKKDNKINPQTIKWNFERFMNLDESENYDGFPTINPIDKEPIFYGTPLIDHTNWALVCGIALPIDLGNWIPNLIGKIVG